jgi:poly(A) polymerase
MFKRKSKVKILERSDHNISRRNIDSDAINVLYRLYQRGHTACLVGGAVRDLLLQRKPKDFDIGTTASPNQIRRLFRNCFLIGRRFRLAHIRFGTKVIECSTFRKKPEPVDATNEEEDSLYLQHDNTYGSPREDAFRRDFTINGIFYDIDRFRIIDYVNGLDDLEKKVIRTIGDPDIRFCEDPVRMIRSIRFASRLKFKIEPRTWSSILRHRSEIIKCSPHRLYEEFRRLFAYGSGADAMRLMKQAGLLDDLVPGIASYLSEAGDKGRFFRNCLKALDVHNAKEESPSDTLIFAAMSYPVFLENLEKYRADGKRINSLVMAQEILRDMSPCLQMPRNTFYRVAHMQDSQRCFEEWNNARFSKRHFVEQKSFFDAAILRDIILAAQNRPVPRRKPWLDLYYECGLDKRNDKKPQSRRRKRRRPRRR